MKRRKDAPMLQAQMDSAEVLVPAEIAKVLGRRPLVHGEEPAQHDALFTCVETSAGRPRRAPRSEKDIKRAIDSPDLPCYKHTYSRSARASSGDGP